MPGIILQVAIAGNTCMYCFGYHLHRETIATRDKTMTDRDSNIMNLQREFEAITDRLKVCVYKYTFVCYSHSFNNRLQME